MGVWGKRSEDDVFKQLGICRTDKWIEEAIDQSVTFEKEKQGALSDLLNWYVPSKHPDLYQIVMMFPQVSSCVASSIQYFYQLGYVKGLSDGEDRNKRLRDLEKLWSA